MLFRRTDPILTMSGHPAPTKRCETMQCGDAWLANQTVHRFMGRALRVQPMRGNAIGRALRALERETVLGRSEAPS